MMLKPPCPPLEYTLPQAQEAVSALTIDTHLTKQASFFSPKHCIFKAITQDTRHIQPEKSHQTLFFCRANEDQDRDHLIEKALNQKVGGLIFSGSKKPPLHLQTSQETSWFWVPQAKQAALELYPLFYPHWFVQKPENKGDPSFCYTTAVTGTNGKTSTTFFIQALSDLLGYNSLALGTLGLKSSAKAKIHVSNWPGLSTVGQDFFFGILEEARRHNMRYLCWEASSHGLEQGRTWPIKAFTGIWTSFSQDHLDYHGDLETYFQAKTLLLKENIQENAVLCAGLPHKSQLIQACKGKNILWYGQEEGHQDLCLYGGYRMKPSLKTESSLIQLRVNQDIWQGDLPFLASFQVENLLAALIALSGQGILIQDLFSVLPHLPKVPGRLEWVSCVKGGNVYVDYAHTPDALGAVLQAIRPRTKGRVMVIFGCGGNRDASKREQMGLQAKRYADWILVTDDNPRYEAPEIIRKAVLKGCPEAQEMGDRREAIAFALSQMGPGDNLIIAGKGHEEGQEIKGEKKPFSDRGEIKRWITDQQKR